MPKINLLPADRAAAAKNRQGLVGVAFTVILFMAVLGSTFLFFKGQETAAELKYEAAVAENASLRREIVELQPYAELRQRYEQGATRVRHALATDVAWGRLLGDFGRMISDKRVWMEGLSVMAAPPSETNPGVYGSVSMNGSGFDYPDVSSWLLTLDSQDWESVTGAWAASVVQTELEDQSLVAWNLTTSLTSGSLSDRSSRLIREVPE